MYAYLIFADNNIPFQKYLAGGRQLRFLHFFHPQEISILVDRSGSMRGRMNRLSWRFYSHDLSQFLPSNLILHGSNAFLPVIQLPSLICSGKMHFARQALEHFIRSCPYQAFVNILGCSACSCGSSKGWAAASANHNEMGSKVFHGWLGLMVVCFTTWGIFAMPWSFAWSNPVYKKKIIARILFIQIKRRICVWCFFRLFSLKEFTPTISR